MDNGSFKATINHTKIGPEDILTKIRDDGDFDRLRLKIIRQLKDDVELRNNILDMVKQSAALNQPGAETMKPRQLSDAIHEEIGEKLMNQISDGLWKIIRSPEGMKKEVTETVHLVCNKLANPNACGESSSLINAITVEKGHDNISNRCSEASNMDGTLSDGEPNEPPGFSLHNHQNGKTILGDRHNEIQRLAMSAVCSSSGEHTQDSFSMGTLVPDGIQHRALHGFSESLEHKQAADDGSDDDPDFPPGFS